MNAETGSSRSRNHKKFELSEIVVTGATLMLVIASLIVFTLLIPKINSMETSLGALTTSVTANTVDSAKASSDLKDKFTDTLDSTKTVLLKQMEAINTNSTEVFKNYLKLDSDQYKLSTDMTTIRTHLNHLESNLGQEVSSVRGNYEDVAQTLENVTTDVNNVGKEIAEISGSVGAANIVTNSVDDNKTKIENLELESSKTDGEVSILGIMQVNGISSPVTTKIINKLFKDNDELRNNPSQLTAILSEKEQESPIRFARNLRDTHALTISDEDALILAYDVLQIPQDKDFYFGNLSSGNVNTAPKISAALDGTADDAYQYQAAQIPPEENAATTDNLAPSTGKLSIIEACTELVEGDKSRDKCFLHFLGMLSTLHPEIEKPKKGFTEAEIEQIRIQHSAINF